MSGHARAASEDSAAQNCLDSDNKRTLPHDAEPDADIHSESYEESGAQIHSENKRKPDAEIQSESYEEPVPHIHSESYEETVAESHSESYEEPVAENHSESKGKPVAENHSESYEEPVPHIHSESSEEPVPEILSESEIKPAPEILSKSETKPFPEIVSTSKPKPRLRKILTQSESESDAESDDGQQRLPGQSLYGKKPERISEEEWEILTQRERESDAESDDGQQRLPGQSRYGKKPQRWISEEEWLDIIKEDPHVRVRSLSDMSIFRIPDFLKDTKREAYVPQRFLLGPYHHGRKKLPAMDQYKERALRRMKTRFNEETGSKNDAEFACNAIDVIRNNEGEIRDSYEESIDCDGKCLARMLSVDGCFILEVLKDLGEVSDPLFGENMVFASNALRDILMLENQIPWIVLLDLLRLENPRDDHVETTLLNLMVKGTCGSFEMSKEDRTALLQLNWLTTATTKVHHLLDLVHKVIVYRPAHEANPENQGEHPISIERCIGRCLQMLPDKKKALNQDFKSIPPAVELKNAGIKFQPCSGGITKIHFDSESSTIYLPLLSITSNTEVIFRNLIAFEMCRPSELNYVSSYVNLMDDLIDSQNDVAFLRSTGILTNQLGSDKEVADLFNGLFKGVTLNMPNIFEKVREAVNKNYKNKTRVQLAELWRDHLSSPWKTLAVAVAFAILCLTLIQTIYTVK